jgi:hypothetical protein
MATGTTGPLRSTAHAPEPDETRGLVRKAVPAEALVTGWEEIAENTQKVTVRWPARHAFYTQSGRYSPLLVTESIRQALALLSHTAHGIPLDHRLGWELLQSTADPHALHTTGGPVDVQLLVTHTAVTRRRLGSVHLSSTVDVLRDDRVLGRARLNYTTHPPSIYDRLRGDHCDARAAFARAVPVPEPVPATRVGRDAVRDVVLSPADGPHTWQLRVDTGHSVLFDHPHDHLPGMVLLEAASQAARAEAQPRHVVPVDFDTTFLRYVEFDMPSTISAERLDPDPEGRLRVKVSAIQDFKLTFTCTVTSEEIATPPTR